MLMATARRSALVMCFWCISLTTNADANRTGSDVPAGDATTDDSGNPTASVARLQNPPIRLAEAASTNGTPGPNTASSFASTSSREPEKPGLIEEILVTAQKRTEALQDVPSSITVLSADELTAIGDVQLSDYAKEIPGLSVSGARGPGRGNVALRGITTGTAGGLVGMYLDDIPFTPSSPNSDTNKIFDPDLADIERIEVLEGPQSTLYGASAMGGLIKYVTKQPQLNDFDGSVVTTGTKVDGGEFGYGARGTVNVPLVPDMIAIRASAMYRQDPGFIDNVHTRESNVNSAIVEGVKLALLVKFSSELETTLGGLVQTIKSSGPNAVYMDPATLRPSLGSLSYSSQIPQPATIKYESLNDTTTLGLPFATLTNSASYATVYNNVISDVSEYAPLVGAPGGVLSQLNTRSRRFTDEIRLSSNPGQIEWLLGGFYTNENDPDNVNIRGTNGVGLIVPPSDPSFNVYTYNNSSHFKESAVFGDFTYHPTDQIEATVGMRYSTNDQSYGYISSGFFGTNNVQGESNASAKNYLVTLSYKLVPAAMLYVRAASAYRPGGPNILNDVEIAAGVPLHFGADTLWNYEAGLKGSSADKRFTYSADVYHMVWTDIQLNVSTQGFTAVANAGSAKADGAEASLQIVPVEGLSVRVKAAYSDAKIESNVPAVGFESGDPLPYSPKISAVADVEYQFQSFNGMTPKAALTDAYRGSQNTGFSNGVSYRLPSYDTVDLRGTLDWSHYSVIARVENLTNKYAVTDFGPTAATGAPFFGVVIRPRTYSLSLAAHF
jgi:iron complex outermembrane recepter protein